MSGNLIIIGLTALMGLLGFVGLMMNQAKNQTIGAKLEAATVTAVTAKAEVSIAQAVVDAPSTQADMVAAMKAGTF